MIINRDDRLTALCSTGSASHMRSSQPNSLFVPRASWDLVQGSLDSVRGSDTWGKRCIYLEGHSETGSETAQVPCPSDFWILSDSLTLTPLVRSGMPLSGPGTRP